MNEKDIQYVLGKHLFLNNVCIPNVSMYCPGHTEYEADFVYFSMKTQFLTEVEIKTNFETLFLSQALITFNVPKTLFLIAEVELFSISGTCL